MSNEATVDAIAAHDEHEHPPFLAHHFETPEQQYDASKFGMWMFLATEVLFFSGMFCAYALYRSLHPEVWTFASQFLNEYLGAFNTVVLLFSSLTMAWAVRCAQLHQRTGLIVTLTITLSCGAIFLGVKAVEYTHKWDLGLLPAGSYIPQFIMATQHEEGISPWLVRLSIPPALFAIGFAVWYIRALVQKNRNAATVAGCLLITALSYFLGVGIGKAFENAEAEQHAAAHAVTDNGAAENAPVSEHEANAHETAHVTDTAAPGESAHGAAPAALIKPKMHPTAGAAHVIADPPVVPGAVPMEKIDQPGGAGLFFSIYYCMTGVHALHILAGLVALAWLLKRAVRDDFNEQYFGPVDNVGLYWHLVDLIWIYLFPLLYLIT